ncbi:linoleate diol synthase, partial [Amylostereum chailletii]
SAVLDLIKNVNDLDDRKMLLEHALTLMSRMPDEFKWAQEMLRRGTVELLYNDLPHPPATYIGPQYSFRNIDGSFNNVTDPEMGKAGTPYARSVQQTHPLPQNMLPDAGLIFDTLLKRDNFVKHPAGLSSMMFSFAALVIHTVFRTSHENVNINETSSYVDLAPLYGSTVEASNKIRQLEGPNFGRGLLYNDTFAEDRLLLLPPAVCVLLVLFSRDHNARYIAHKLLEINERDTWKDPKDLKPAELLSQDNEIFHTARLVNCAWFASAIFSDYFGSILGLVRQGSNWSLNPFGEMRDSDHKLFERGRGNVCSVEFNCLYRWHATTSEVDEKWIEQLMDQTFPNKSIDELKPTDFITALKDIKAKEPDVQHWTFGRMQRQEDGSFKTTDLAAIIKNATEHPASAFKARGTPHIMRLHEIMGIEANRRWGVCSLNEFRKWNPDPEIAEAAERLYGDIERLELYVGLQAEEAKPVVDGAGLCPGYTISRAILSDAIALTRGDRFFTADYTPFNMTAWGYADCQRDPDGPGNGSMLGRLLLRTLPGEYEENSTYAWFPLQTPESMKGFLKKLDMEAQYKFERPGDPQPVVTIKEYRDIEQIMKSSEFKEPYGVKASRVLEGDGYVYLHFVLQRFFIATEDTFRGTRQQEEVLRALAPSDKASDSIAQFFYQKTRSLLQSKSFTLSDKSVKNVDIVRDVLRYAPLHWAATEIAGIQLKSDKHDSGVYTEPELYEMLADISSFLFLDSDPSKGLRLEQRVREHIRDLKRHIRTNLVAGNRLSIVGTLQNLFNRSPKKARHPFAQSLFEQGGSVDAVTNNILAIMVGATAQLSQCLINAVNFYMNSTDLIAQVKTAGANNAGLEGYIYESMRLDPPFRGIYREATSDQTIGSHTISKGQRVFVDIAAASHDPDVFPDPRKFDINRQSHGKYLTGDGATRCLGDDLTTKIMGQVIRAVFEVDNLRRAPGDSGRLKRYKTDAETSLRYEYLGSDQLPSAWPNSMLLQVGFYFEVIERLLKVMTVRSPWNGSHCLGHCCLIGYLTFATP